MSCLKQAKAKKKASDWLASVAKKAIDNALATLHDGSTTSSSLRDQFDLLKQQRSDFIRTFQEATDWLARSDDSESEKLFDEWQVEATEIVTRIDRVLAKLSKSHSAFEQPNHRNGINIYAKEIQQLFVDTGGELSRDEKYLEELPFPKHTNTETQSSKDEVTKQVEVFLLEERYERFMDSSMHKEALESIDQIREIQPKRMKTELMLAEFLFKIENHQECFKTIKHIITMTSTLPKDYALHLIQRGVRGNAGSGYITTLTLFWSSCSVFYEQYHKTAPTEALRGIALGLSNMDDLSQHVEEEWLKVRDKEENLMKNFAKIFFRVLHDVEDLLNTLVNINGDGEKFVLAKMRCQGSKADCHRDLDEYADGLVIYLDCIEEMKTFFPEKKVSQHYIYSEFLVNAAICFSELGDKTSAERYMKESDEAMRRSHPATLGEIIRKEEVGKKFKKIRDNIET